MRIRDMLYAIMQRVKPIGMVYSNDGTATVSTTVQELANIVLPKGTYIISEILVPQSTISGKRAQCRPHLYVEGYLMPVYGAIENGIAIQSTFLASITQDRTLLFQAYAEQSVSVKYYLKVIRIA